MRRDPKDQPAEHPYSPLMPGLSEPEYFPDPLDPDGLLLTNTRGMPDEHLMYIYDDCHCRPRGKESR